MAGFGPNLPPAIRAGIKAAGKPQIRQSAAAQHLGAPQKPPRAPQRAPKAQTRARPPAKIGSGQKAIGTLNPGDIHNRAVTGARLARNAELNPLEAQGRDITANEQGATQAYGKLVGAGNTQLEGISTNVGNSAKTAENAAAEQALSTPKAIETSGQSQASMTAGYMTPELRAELGAEAQQAGSSAGARASAAQNIAQEGSNLIEQIRAAASLKALGGQQNITNYFQKQQRANQIAKEGVIAKVGPRILEGESKLGQQNFTDRATAESLGLKGASLRQAGELGRGRIGATIRGQTLTAGSRAADRAQRERANIRTTGTAERDTTARIQAGAEKRAAKAGTKVPASQQKFLSELGSAASRVQRFRSGTKKLTDQGIREAISKGQFPESYKSKGKKGVRIVHEKAIGNQAIINAALEVWNPPHAVSPQTRRELTAAGYNPGSDAELYEELYQGHLPNPALSGVKGKTQAGVR